jgi:HPt (histidine-containing phosphotransfer) domain-containing protein
MNGDQKNIDIFDRDAMRERLMGDEDIVDAVLERFLSDTPQRIDALEKAMAQGDTTQIHIHAHTLKSAAANINAAALRDAALALETAVESGGLDAAQTLVPKIREQFDILKMVLGAGED